MRNVSNKFIEKIKTHILHSITFYENRAIYEACGKMQQSRIDHMTFK